VARPGPDEAGAALSDLLASLYTSIAQQPPWQAFLEVLAPWLGASFATLIIAAPGTREPATFITPGSSPAFDSAYRQTLFAEDPFSRLPEGVVTSYAEFMASQPAGAHAEYRAAIAASGFDRVLGIDIHPAAKPDPSRSRGADHFEARFRISRHAGLPDFGATEIARLQCLAPHLRIALGLFERLQFAGAEQAVFQETVERLGRALIVLDRDHAVVSANPLAERILTEREGLYRLGDRLAFADQEHQRQVARALAAEQPLPEDRIRIERTVHGDLVVALRPLNLDAIHAGAGALALIVSRPGSEPAADRHAIRELLGLTAAEARLASVLAEGAGLVEAARRIGIAHNTAKAQLQSIFAKTGVNRQAKLVALLTALKA